MTAYYIKVVDRLNKGMTYLIAFILAVIAVIIAVQIFSRYVLGMPLRWSEELARYLMIWLVFLGSALALRRHALIGIDILVGFFSDRIKRIIKTMVYLICLVFFVFLIAKGIEILDVVKNQRSPGLRISMIWAYSAIPVGAFFMLLNSIAVMLEIYTKE